MAYDEGAATIRAFYASFDERPYGDSIGPFLHDDVVWQVAGSNPLAGTFTGVPEVLGAMRSFADASAGALRLDTQTVLADEGHAVAVHIATATVAGFDYRAHEIDVFHLRDGRIAAFWSFSEDQQATDRFWRAARRAHA